MLGYAEINSLPNYKGLFSTSPRLPANPAVPRATVLHDIAQLCTSSMVPEAGEKIMHERSTQTNIHFCHFCLYFIGPGKSQGDSKTKDLGWGDLLKAHKENLKY